MTSSPSFSLTSSLSSSPTGSDLNPSPLELADKYQRLLQEYSKVKKNNSILKKAVKQEQDINSNNEKTLKVNEEKIRHFVQENDSLNFNNDRLTKRLEALQEQFQEVQQKGNGGSKWFGGKKLLAKKDEDIDVLQTELTQKIQENENLHSRVTEIRKEHDMATQLLNNKLLSLKNTLQQTQDQADEDNKKYISETKRLESEIDQLRDKVRSLEGVLSSLQGQIDIKERELREVSSKLQLELARTQETLKLKVLFDDTKYSHLNMLNLPSSKTVIDARVYDVADKGVQIYQNLVRLYNEYHKSFEDRLDSINKSNSVNENLRTINKKIISLMPQYTKHLTSIGETFQWIFLKSRSGEELPSDIYKTVAFKLQQFTEFNKNILSCHLLRLDEECKQSNVPTSIQANNSLLSDTRFQFQSNLEQMISTLTRFLVPSDERRSNVAILKDFVADFSSLINTFKTLLTQTAYKISQEHQDPFVNPSLRESNEHLLKSHSELTYQFDLLLNDCLIEYIQILDKPTEFAVRGVTNIHHDTYQTSTLKSRAQNFMTVINSTPDSVHISYEESVKNSTLVPQLESRIQKLTEELSTAQRSIDSLTKDKSNLQNEVSNAKDKLAEKQSRVTSILEDLATSRQQISVLNTAYEKLANSHTQLKEQMTQLKSQLALAQQAKHTTPVEAVNVITNSNPPAVSFSAPATPTSNHVQRPVDTSNLISFDDNNLPPQNPMIDFFSSPVESTIQAITSPSPSTNQSSVDLLSLDDGIVSQPISNPQPIVLEDSPIRTRFDLNDSTDEVSITTRPRSSSDKWKVTVMDENGKQSENLQGPDAEREAAMKSFYDLKIQSLTTQAYEADEKAIKCYHAFKLAKNQIQKMLAEKTDLQKSLDASTLQLRSVQDDTVTIRKSYEEQMNVLTEHMTIQNERIAQLDNEMGSVMNSKVYCTKCKKWNTVRWLMTEGKNGQRCNSGNHGTNFNFAS